MNSEIETQIRECEARLYNAMSTSDVSELDVLIADDLLFAGPTGELATKAMDLELHRTGSTQFHEFVPAILRTQFERVFELQTLIQSRAGSLIQG